MRLKPLFAITLSLSLLGSGCLFGGVERTEKFRKPDIKDEFCGVHINYQYCKCAFHDEFCDQIGLSRSAANAYVRDEYDKWVDGLKDGFKQSCVTAGAAYDDPECHYCKLGYHPEDGSCEPDEEDGDAEEEDGGDEETSYKPDGPLNDDCTLKRDEFDADWRKYSDMDDRIPFESRSWEAQQALTAYDSMIDSMVRAFEIERDIEIEKALQADLEEYKNALVKDLKTNLLKSFWRLAWVTYSTVDSARGVGSSYSTLLTEGLGVETVGAGLKVIQANVPKDSTLAIDTGSITGKAKSVGANTALEAIDSLGDPVSVATEFVKSSTMAAMPSADISPEEVAILRQQHLQNGAIDEALRQSRETVTAMEGMLLLLEQDIADYRAEIEAWEAKEKERVAASLTDSCKELTGQE